MFRSTYVCEGAFSKINFIKNNIRSLLTDEQLNECKLVAPMSHQILGNS